MAEYYCLTAEDARPMFDQLKTLTKGKSEQPATEATIAPIIEPVASPNIMVGINSYGRELTEKDIQSNEHRNFIGGLWKEIGQLQYDFMLEQGLQPHHTLLDIGCGCLRGGLYFIDYLESDRYYGLDVNNSLIQAAHLEVEQAGLSAKNPQLLVSDKFAVEQFQQQFDYMLSISLFSHLPMNIIIRCLSAVQKNLAPGGKYFSTFFIAPSSVYLDDLKHEIGGVTTFYDRDPFHYSLEEICYMAESVNLTAKLIDEWNHPRNQQMVEFSRSL